VSYDDVADQYDATRGGEGRGDDFASIIDARLPPAGGPILDIGIGTGVVALGLQKRDRTVVGVDLSMAMLCKARDRVGTRVVLADGGVLPIATGSVEHAMSVWVVHHVQEPHRLFAEVHRVLRDGGRYLVFPNYRTAPEDPVGSIILSMHERAKVGGNWQASPMDASAILGIADAEGFTGIVETVWSRPRETTAGAEIDAIRVRAYPALSDLDDRTYQLVAGPAIAALSELPDGPIVRPAVTDVVLLHKR
jgi:ubiquinone/menaquinone biosynthesis C-methylase UbiE